jgi:hypothetical protein
MAGEVRGHGAGVTTIACSRDEMACESLCTFGSESFVCDEKVIRIGDELVGCAGDTDAIFKFLEWYRTKGERPEIDGEKRWEVVVLSKAGIQVYVNSLYPMNVREKFYVAGTGSMAAKAAMLCGKSPTEAVRIAIKCDRNSGGPVRTFPLKPKRADSKNA